MKTRKVVAYIFGMAVASIVLAGCNEDDKNNGFIDNEDKVENQFVRDNDWEKRVFSYSKDESISIEEAERRLTIMDSAHMAVPMIEEHFRENISGSYFGSESGNFSLNIRNSRLGEKSVLDEGFVERVKDTTGVPIHIINNSLSNKAQMDSFLADSYSELIKEKHPQSISYDPELDEITVSYYNTENTGHSYEKLKNKIINNPYSKKVNFTNAGDLPKVDVSFNQPVVGGADIKNYGATSGCTTGFAAYLNGVKGVLTAGHCEELGQTMYWYISNLGDYYRLGKSTNNKSLIMDIEFFPVITEQPLAAGFYQDERSTALTPVDRVGTASDIHINEYICHFGQTTGVSCGYVKGLTPHPSAYGCNGWTKTGDCGLTLKVQGPSLKRAGGDSGGPWFKTNANGEYIALGIHSGGTNYPPTAYVSQLYLANDLAGSLYIPTAP